MLRFGYTYVKSNNLPRLRSQFKDPVFAAHNRSVAGYQIPTRLEEIEKLANAVNKALPDRDLAFSANLVWKLITNTILYGLKGAADRFIHVE